MLKPAAYKAPSYVIQKLFRLLDVLKSERDKYSQAASTITDRQLRDNISVLAQENNQYACELLSQLQILGTDNYYDQNVTEPSTSENLPLSVTETSEPGLQNTGSILQHCRDSEKKMIGIYRQILNEPYLMEDIRRLMRCQLNGIMYAFLRLKLLSSTM